MKKKIVPKEYDMEVTNHLNFISYEKRKFPLLKYCSLHSIFYFNLCLLLLYTKFFHLWFTHLFLLIASSTKSINIYEISMQHIINNELKGTCFYHYNEIIGKEK
jgi:hypothetical protein